MGEWRAWAAKQPSGNTLRKQKGPWAQAAVQHLRSAIAEADAALARIASLRGALYDLTVVGLNLARITPEGDRIEPLPETWHRLDEVLEQASAALDARSALEAS